MKVEIRDLSSVQKEMTIEVPAERVSEEFRKAVGQVRRKATISGFRKGKAPAEVIRQRYGREIGQQVEENLSRSCVTEAFEERSIRPLGHPAVKLPDPVDGQPFTITVRFEVRPEIDPKDYLGQEVARPDVEVTDDDTREELEKWRQSAAYLVPVDDRGADEGDAVLADLSGTDPVSGEALRHEGVSLVVGEEGTLPDFDRALRGVKPKDEKEFDVSYPDDFRTESLRGKRVRYLMKVREVKRREVPVLDDDFAQDAGGFETLEEMRKTVSERLVAAREAEADRVAKDRLLGKIADAHDFEVPQSLVEAHLDGRMEEMAYSLMMQGIDPREQDIDWKSIREEQRDRAQGYVKRMLLIDAIIEKEKLELTREELDGRIEAAARAHKERPEVYRNRLKKEGSLEAFENQALRQKCLDFVYAAAKIS
jgi:trigger factor